MLVRNERTPHLTGRSAPVLLNAAVQKPTHAHDALLNGFKTPTVGT